MFEETKNPSVVEALSGVMRDVGAIGKDRRNQAQNYNFRGIDDFMNAVHPALVAHGVIVMPHVIDRQVDYTDRTTDKGKASVTTHVWLTMRFDFIGPAGDVISCTTIGEAADTADKAGNKAMSAAFKYALMQGLCIPLEDIADSDRDNPDMGSRHAYIEPEEWQEDPASAQRRAELVTELGQQTNEVKAAMTAWLREQRISLRVPQPQAILAEVDAKLDAVITEREVRLGQQDAAQPESAPVAATQPA